MKPIVTAALAPPLDATQIVRHSELTRPYVPAPLNVVPGAERSPEELTSEIEQFARNSLYGPLPYHNWDHVLNNAVVISALMERFEQAGIPFDRTAVVHANLGHDGLFQLNHRYFGFRSKEELICTYFYNFLREIGAPEEHARKVERIIFATLAHAKPELPEETLMRAGDLAGLAAAFPDFIENTRRLHDETMRLSRREFPFEQFAEGTLRYLSLYLWRDLNVTDSSRTLDGTSVWHLKALSNMIELFRTIRGEHTPVTVAAVVLESPSLENFTFLDTADPNRFSVIVAPGPITREKAAEMIESRYAGGTLAAPAFVVPGSLRGIPLTWGVCDELRIRSDNVASDRSWTEIRLNELLKEGRRPIFETVT